jgi:hypothetical protein
MCRTADGLKLTQYEGYSRRFNDQTICPVQQAVECGHNMCGTADSLKLTIYVC